jgi:hypothetical protein
MNNWAVYISDQLYDYTDGLGRIHINKPNGNYDVTLRKGEQTITITLTIDGRDVLKVILVP